MKYENLKAAAQTIKMPDDVKRRVAETCKTQILTMEKESDRKYNRNTVLFRKPALAVMALVICLTLSVTAVAASGILGGYFRDIQNWRGVVVGTSYEQATDEISVYAAAKGSELSVQVTFSDPQAAPYVYAERLGIAAYKILDAEGKTVQKGAAESAEIINGQAVIWLALDGIDNGRYQLEISAFVSEKKADQPLHIHGNWICEFTKG